MHGIAAGTRTALVLAAFLFLAAIPEAHPGTPVLSADTLRLSGFSTFYPEYGKPPVYPVHGVLVRQDDTLYIKVEATFGDQKPIAQVVLKDRYSWQDDYVLVIIDPEGTRMDGYEFGLNSIGTTYDAIITNVNRVSNAWNGNWKGKASMDSTFWIAEFWIPLKGLVRGTVDSIGINIIRGFIRRPSGVYEAVSLVPLEPGASQGPDMRFTERVPFEVSGSCAQLSGYGLPYVRAELLKSIDGELDVVFGIEARLNYGKHSVMTAFRPDFSSVGANVYSLDIMANRFSIAENRYFFTESQKFTALPVNTFYSKLIADDIDWGLQYDFDMGATELFLMSLRAPLIEDIFTLRQSDFSYQCSMLAGSRTFDSGEIQFNVSSLSAVKGSEPTRYHFDLFGVYAPSWVGKAQMAYDAKNKGSLIDISFSAPRSGAGPYLGVDLDYISRRYAYPLSYLRWGNNVWSVFVDGGYRWIIGEAILPSASVGTSLFHLCRLEPRDVLVRSASITPMIEIVPQTYIAYRFQYDDRPATGFTNRYHVLDVDCRLGKDTAVNGTALVGDFYGKTISYRRLGLMTNPVEFIQIEADYTARKLSETVDEFYTVMLTVRIHRDFYFRSYYQHLSLPSVTTSSDILNFLVNYYLTNRNNVYVVVNLRESLETADVVGRIGYEIDF